MGYLDLIVHVALWEIQLALKALAAVRSKAVVQLLLFRC